MMGVLATFKLSYRAAMKYYKLDVGSIPDELHNKGTDVKDWLSLATTARGKFPTGSLAKVLPIDRGVEMERINGISLYMIGNVLPFFLPLILAAALISDIGLLLLKLLLLYFGTMLALNKYYFFPKFIKKYNRPKKPPNDIRDNQYIHTERNNQKYTSLKFVWPESIHRPALDGQPVIFCAIPHGAAPLGITAYPIWSKLFNEKLCRWTCAPVVLKLPFISTFMKKVGYIPAKAKDILETLTKKEENVGIILDGIAGMFQGHDEIAHIQQRKGIIKIALRAGVPIVPVYGFGHTKLWRIVVDPFRILEKLSCKLDISVCPFFGRFFWFLGPPMRVAVCCCLGEPVRCPKLDDIKQEDIDKYHTALVKSYHQIFEAHKDAYGWGDKKLMFV